ncbi:MAG: outer membrane beta-barrel protein, partial [Alphaproteobacteria bacterium]|nr:outer membrane beta-barrel protein [Alphaproteobacteria bacterium]
MTFPAPSHVRSAGLSSLATLLMLGGITPAAMAQQYDPFDRLGTLQGSDNPFGRDRNVGVSERSRPDYEAVPIKAGSLEIMPQLVTKLDLDDNIYALNAPRVGDGILHIRPRLSIGRPSPDLAWSIAGEYEGTRYFQNGSENTDDYAVQGSARYTIRRNTILDLRLLQSRNSEERTSPDSPAAIVRPNRFDRSEAYGELAHSFNRLRLRGTLDYERRNYIDNHDNAGNEIDQDFRDRSTLTGSMIAEYAFSPSFALFTAASSNTRDYRARTGLLPARDSSGYELALGANFELGRLMRGSLRLGYLEQDYKDPLFNDVGGLLVRGELAYF